MAKIFVVVALLGFVASLPIIYVMCLMYLAGEEREKPIHLGNKRKDRR